MQSLELSYSKLLLETNGCQYFISNIQPFSSPSQFNHTQISYGELCFDKKPAIPIIIKQLIPNFQSHHLSNLKREFQTLQACQTLAVLSNDNKNGIPSLFATNLLSSTTIFAPHNIDTQVLPCLITSYHQGKTLKSFITQSLQSPILTFKQKLFLFLQICEVVQRLHKLDFIHLDIKPSNIIITNNLNVVMIDFGLSQNCKKLIARNHFDSHMTAGTPAYISPEQLTGKFVDKHSDYYSLGILLFELLSGKTPFHAKDLHGWAIAHCQTPVPYLTPNSQLTDHACQACQPFIDKLLAKHPQNRVESLEQVINALKIMLSY